MKNSPSPGKVVYSVVMNRGKRASMVRIGRAANNGDGSIMVYLDALPHSRTLLIREASEGE